MPIHDPGKQARLANLRQQGSALAWQDRNIATQEGLTKDAFAGLFETIQAQGKQRLSDVDEQFGRQWGEGSAMQQGAKRSTLRDLANALSAGTRQKADAMRGIHAEASYPMIQTTAVPSGLGALLGQFLGSMA